MGIFGKKEGYSKDKFDEAAKAHQNAEQNYCHLVVDKEFETPQAAFDFWNEESRKGRREIKKLFGESTDEAIALNKEYDKLLDKQKQAMEALKEATNDIESFKKEKLNVSH